MRSKTLEDLLNSITEEDMQRWRKSAIEIRDSLTIDEMLGYYIGEELCRTKLPRLSTDGFSRSIKVSKEDEEEYKRLSELHSSKYKPNDPDSSKEEWVEYRKFAKEIQKKYLPNPFIVRFRRLNVNAISDMKKFKQGFIESLWDDDFCHYSLSPENIKVYNSEDSGEGIIELVYNEKE